MTPEQGIPVKYEKLFRDALGHAGHDRVGELRTQLHSMTDQEVAAAIQLCALTTAYTAIDVVDRRWPTDAGVRRMAENATESLSANAWPGVTTQNVYLFLSRCALGFEDLAEVLGGAFPDTEDLLMAPFFLTIELLATFSPEGKTMWEFLDVIEAAYEGAWPLDLNLLPALMVRSRMEQAAQAQKPNGATS